MNEQDREITAIVKKLKERAAASPWVPLGVPPREHFHRLSNGLRICFTLDDLPGVRYWHLSISRVPGDLAPEEIEFWRHAFFNGAPAIELPAQISGLSTRQFYWVERWS